MFCLVFLLSKICAWEKARQILKKEEQRGMTKREELDLVRQRPTRINILNSHGLFDEDLASYTKSALVSDMAGCAISGSATSRAVVPPSVEVFLMLSLQAFLSMGQRVMGEEL